MKFNLFVLLFVVCVAAYVQAKDNGLKLSRKTSVASPLKASCTCEECSTECVSEGGVGGVCYNDTCYCATFGLEKSLPRKVAADDCTCEECSSECVNEGAIGGVCYQNECYCATF